MNDDVVMELNKAVLLEIAISSPLRSDLNSAARHAENPLADVVQREKNICRGSFTHVGFSEDVGHQTGG